MSAALDLMKSLAADGVEFSTDGVRIRWRNGGGRVTPDVVATLAAEKATVIDFLSGKDVPAGVPASPDPEDLRAAFEERAAILEYDAGLSREEAEQQATAEVYGSERVVVSISETGVGKTGETFSIRPMEAVEFDPVSRPSDPETYAEALRVHGPMSYGMAVRVLGWGGTRAGQAEMVLRAAGRIAFSGHGRAFLPDASDP
jgi:hypothetical protein